MGDEEKNKLTEEEEALLREFEDERRKKKDRLADAVKELMEREAVGAIESDVKREVEKEMERKVEEHVKKELKTEPAKEAPPAPAIDTDEMKKRIEQETREKLEKEMRAKIEEEARKKVEEQRAELEARIRKEMEEKERRKKEELIEQMKKLKEEEDSMRAKMEEEMRGKIKEEIKKEMEEERQKKKEELMKKLESAKKAADAENADTGSGIGHNDKVLLLQLFEESQAVMLTFLSTRIKKSDIEDMYFQATVRASQKYPDVLKRVMFDKTGQARPGGMLDAARLLSNLTALAAPEDKKNTRFYEALRHVFEERIIDMEVKTSNDIKNKVVSDVLNQMKKMMQKRAVSPKITSIFLKQIFPSTTLSHGG